MAVACSLWLDRWELGRARVGAVRGMGGWELGRARVDAVCGMGARARQGWGGAICGMGGGD